ncbi:hypothetical protein DBB42_05465 [Pseudomonas plecoglossicida]|uniref:Uncharacterized protein n=1 Tax=Pseudomonas plecoglossicida TaxID=70775 RepID=A0A2R7UMF8_PSEDL|nr:hypothetical protein DBB42_05465 [Pseudomonas plecoglossicida]RFP99776.1 hypothetical protein D0O09_20895 [Pseudomonas putida]
MLRMGRAAAPWFSAPLSGKVQLFWLSMLVHTSKGVFVYLPRHTRPRTTAEDLSRDRQQQIP